MSVYIRLICFSFDGLNRILRFIYTHVYTHTHTLSLSLSLSLSRTHIDTYIHTHIYTHAYIYIYIYIYIYTALNNLYSLITHRLFLLPFSSSQSIKWAKVCWCNWPNLKSYFKSDTQIAIQLVDINYSLFPYISILGRKKQQQQNTKKKKMTAPS